MVLYKWCQDWQIRGNPPNLIQTMIAMFLSPGSIDADKQLYQGQAGFQVLLLLVAFFSVPVMLFVKPYMNKKKHEREALTRVLQQQQGDRGAFSSLSDEEQKVDEYDSLASPTVAAGGDGHSGGEHHGEYDFADEMIHQVRDADGGRPPLPWLFRTQRMLTSCSSFLLLFARASTRSSSSSAPCLTPPRTFACGRCPSPTPSCRPSFGRR